MTPGIGKPIPGTLINISAGGLCLLVNPQHKETCAMGRHFWLRLDLDQETGRLWEIGKIVHIKETDNGNHRLGVRFELAFHPDHGKCVQEAICAFIAEQQRRQLQRAR